MANAEEDPGASTQQFRAYVDKGRDNGAEKKRSVAPFVIVGLIVVVAVVAVILYLV